MTRELLIDGWALGKTSVGLGVYAHRLVSALCRRRSELNARLTVVAPSSLRGALSRLALPPDAFRFRAAPMLGHGLLNQALWQQTIGALALARSSALFSPIPFWSVLTPRHMAIAQHDRIYRHFPRYLGSLGIRRQLTYLAESTLARSAVVVTASEHARDDLANIRGLGLDRIRVIPDWLPPGYTPERAALLVPAVRQKYCLPARFWLYVGGYDYRKNVEHLIRAYAGFASRAGAPRLVLAGRISRARGPYCDVESALRCAGLGAAEVLCPGMIDAEDLPGLYGAAELLVYPSRFEGFGLPPIEAMGCGCPAICADNSSLPEVVHDVAYRFATDDDDALASLLGRAFPKRLPINPSFRRENFDEQAAITSYIDLFNRLVET